MGQAFRIHSIAPPKVELFPLPLGAHAAGWAGPLRGWLLSAPGIAAAWLSPSLLEERASPAMMVIALADRGWEGSTALDWPHATQPPAHALTITAISRESLEDALAIDAELAEVIAKGYRACGGQGEVHELEALARAIIGVEANAG